MLLSSAQPLLRRPLFWIPFIGFSILCALFAFYYFPTAFPLVNIDIKMDRVQALNHANELAKQYGWGPEHAQQATSFIADTKVQHFVELEGGGNKAFIEMLKQKLYEAYTWQVRHFQEHNPHELTIIFTPEGNPYGFTEKLPDDRPGSNISSVQAQTIAEQQASFWNIDLSNYQLVERSQEEKAGKRIDHTLVYERPTPTIGEGTYRVQFVVSGDKLTEVKQLVKVPESFNRKYEHMRSVNNSIASASLMLMWLLYIALLSALGTVYLIKQRALSWRTALYWALFLAVIQTLTSINDLPLRWMKYNTALSKMVFLGAIANTMLISFLFYCAFYSLIFVAAEGLGRLAFGDQLQLWRMWQPRVANSITVLGYTFSAYLLVPMMLAYVVLTYFITRSFFGWWTPSEALLDPDILATYVPWLNAIGNSLNAGFFEECLFRAVPLASAALIGRHFKKEKLFIAIAFIAQAFIFGAGHANYAAQPAYARVVELILPSFGFASIYLAFGLLPGIIIHFLYDVVWYALPIFVSHGTSALINQIVIILLCLVPLLIIAYRMQQQKSLSAVDVDYLNRSWQSDTPEQKTSWFSTTKHITLPGFIIIGSASIALALLGFLLLRPLQTNGVMIQPNRTQAVRIARNTIEGMNISLSADWQDLPTIKDTLEPADRFIWQYGSQTLYDQLRTSYLKPPRWVIRLVNFNAPVADRAEEYNIAILEDGSVQRVQHKLPEGRPGADLQEEQARAMTLTTLKTLFNVEPPAIVPISAVANKQPARKDWTFTYQYPAIYPLKQGQARLVVVISGDQVTDVYRYIYTPEEWTRRDQNEQGLLTILKQFCWVAVIIILAVSSFFYMNQYRLMSGKLVLYAILIIFLIKSAYFLNALPTQIASFNTSVPPTTQLFLLIGQWLPKALIQVCALSMLMGMLMFIKPTMCIANRYKITVGFSFGIITALVIALLKKLTTTNAPFLANYSYYAHYNAALAFFTNTLEDIILQAMILWMLSACIQTQRLSSLTKVGIILMTGLFMGGSLFSVQNVTTFAVMAISFAVCLLIAYFMALQYEPALAIPFSTGFYGFLTLQQGIAQPYPSALISAGIAVAIIVAIITYLFQRVTRLKPC